MVALTFFVLADDGATNSVVIQGVTGPSNNTSMQDSFSLTVNAEATSSTKTFMKANVSYTSGTCVMTSAGTTTFELSPVSSDFSCSTTSSGYSIYYTVSGSTATITIDSDGTASSALMGFDINSSYVNYLGSGGVTGYSYTASSSSGGSEETPATPPSNTMQGLLNGVRYIQATASQWRTYNQYIGFYEAVMSGQVTLSDGSSVDANVDYTGLQGDFFASIYYNAYSWKVGENGELVFNSGTAGSNWLDMIWKYLTYDYYWGTRLWSNDTSGSWYGDIKSSFSYLNYRVNQIFEVLANDEDLKIKDATDEEREWVQDYFENGTDIADSEKYDKLNGTTSAFKDLFSGAPDSSIADGFSAVNDNGYDFWSKSVSDEINGASIASIYSDDPDLQIVDFYSENFAKIVGGSDD